MRIIKTIVYLFIIVLSYSCHVIPCGWDSDLQPVKGQPSMKSLIGIYRPDKMTKQSVSEYEKLDSSEIVLQEEGKLIFKNIPISTIDIEKYSDNNNQLINGTGKWTVRNDEGEAEIFVTLNYAGSSSGFLTSYSLYKKEDKYVIFIIIGDPDECSAARFIKE